MNVFEVIQKKIETVSNTAEKTFRNAMMGELSADMFRLGFSSSPSVIYNYEKLNKDEVLRAQLIRYFGNGRIMHEREIKSLEKQYDLVTMTAERFKDNIPEVNQRDIVNFAQ